MAFFGKMNPIYYKEFGVKKAMDLEQETWVMHVPRYIAEISIILAIWPCFGKMNPILTKNLM